MTRFRFLPLLLLVLVPARLWAWGVEGHRAVGRLAERHLTSQARRAVHELLGTETVTLVSTWSDEILYPPVPEFKGTSPWHYVNSPAGLGHDQYVQDLKAQTIPNAYRALLDNLAILKDKSKPKADRAVALKFVIHLVGDVHQPLHAGRLEDKGGNSIKLTYRGKDTNLHSLWDSGLLDYQGLSYSEMGQQYDDVPKAQQRQWQRDDVTQWLWESYQLSEQIYAEAAQNPTGFDYRYYPAHGPQVQQRIQQAGLRLAAVLNDALK
ncbi:S1/P1 nuclease [Hymenobacter coccineus]|uniref:S1/P1 Nuclease n=1 Tax=Hymenobacter coccineus TaxID=1908235 RepID=A0A1G1SZN0_9BACT|nr:S1/P1 nuclease [Hymenobacter coccineus]OGX84066.1 hypothetical protein BEN49_11680 [Hymenobacter coccineus]